MRLRITFAKTEAMRFTGHLDLFRAWERTMRRARLPLAYSLGFRPHPRINLASALPLGFTSQGEVVDIWLEQAIPLSEIGKVLQPALPPGLEITDIREIAPNSAPLQTELASSEFIITFLEPFPDLESGLEALLATESLPRIWRDKSYDLRPLIQHLHLLTNDTQGRQRVMLQLAACQGATGRPEEVVAALGFMPGKTRVLRTRLVFHPAEQEKQ